MRPLSYPPATESRGPMPACPPTPSRPRTIGGGRWGTRIQGHALLPTPPSSAAQQRQSRPRVAGIFRDLRRDRIERQSIDRRATIGENGSSPPASVGGSRWLH